MFRDTFFSPLRSASLMVLLLGIAALSGCERYSQKPQCGSFFEAGQLQGWKLEDAGTAIDPETGLRWYRCNAGEKFQNSQCVGSPLELNFAQANAYVAEVAAASGKRWRLPTASEVKSITQTACTNPAINSQVFPTVLVENYWVSSKGAAGRSNACVFYSFSGNVSCLESADEKRPFWMVMERR